jgi:hypothetical protein
MSAAASYISAYDLQQQRGLSRREVLKLAAAQPTYWKQSDWHYGLPYFNNGLETLKANAVVYWHLIASTLWIRRKEPHLISPYDICEISGYDEFLYRFLPPFIKGKAASLILKGKCPLEIQNNPDKDYTLRSIIGMMEFEDMLKLVQFPNTMLMKYGAHRIVQIKDIHEESAKDIKERLWSYLLHDDYVVIDLFFERYFRECLYFEECLTANGALAKAEDDAPSGLAADNKTQTSIHVPRAQWVGKRPSVVLDCMRKEYPDYVIAHVLYEWCEQTATTIGELLPNPRAKEPATSPSAHLRRGNKLLEEAAAFNIITD